MLLKVVVFGYVSNIYSSRKLKAACRENVNFMWLSTMNYPDHNTINRFRGVRLKEALRQIFEQIVLLLADEGLLNIEDIYTEDQLLDDVAESLKISKKTAEAHLTKALKFIRLATKGFMGLF